MTVSCHKLTVGEAEVILEMVKRLVDKTISTSGYWQIHLSILKHRKDDGLLLGTYRMVKQQGMVFIELQLLCQGLLVHRHSRTCGKPKGGAGEADVLRHIAGIYGFYDISTV